jgi:preprotein translocase subunit SecB
MGAEVRMPRSRLSVERQYVRSLTYEAHDVPAVFAEFEGHPDVVGKVGVDVGSLDGDLYEVVLRLIVACGPEDQPLFELDLEYAAIVRVDSVLGAAAPSLLQVEVPALLFPFARNLIANITAESGFPPVLLDPIRFGASFDGPETAEA